jgi:glycosyltransferase involved in cell wall biosynthesis
MRISYAITVCNEHRELEKLLRKIYVHKRLEDEIVILGDGGNVTPEVYSVLEEVRDDHSLRYLEHPLNRDFAAFKNYLFDNCQGDWIFQIDADELPATGLLENLVPLLEQNEDVEALYVARVNTVEGLTPEHVKRWGWRTVPVMTPNGPVTAVNWPDWQCRIFQNKPHIRLTRNVHEQLGGMNSYAPLPPEYDWSLIHPKQIDRQERQNAFYDTL